jgi:hypothetical protein
MITHPLPYFVFVFRVSKVEARKMTEIKQLNRLIAEGFIC